MQLWVQVLVRVQTCEWYTMCCGAFQVETTKVGPCGGGRPVVYASESAAVWVQLLKCEGT